jgi:WD40 repeat protein
MDQPLPPGLTRRLRLGPFPGRLHRAAWSPDGRVLAVPGDEHRLRIVEVECEGREREIPLESPAWSVAFSPDGRRLAIGQAAPQVDLWDWQAGRRLHRLALASRTSAATALFLADGETVVTGSGKGRLYVWNAVNGTQRQPKIEAHGGTIYALELRPGGDLFATASQDSTVGIWEADTFLKVRDLRGHGRSVYAAAWSPDGRLLASGSADATVRLWDPDTGEELRTLPGHRAAVVGVSFSADGRLLASKSLDGTVRLWRTDRWETVAELPETADPRNPFGLLAFHPREPLLATAGEMDRSLQLWAIDTERLLAPRPAETAMEVPPPPARVESSRATTPADLPDLPVPAKPARTSVFVSYSRKDHRWLERLKTMLAPLARDGGLDLWDDSRIPPGAEWKAEIEKALASAKVAVLLVSPDFLASPFIATEEVPYFLKAAEQEGVTLLWVCLRSCLWKRTVLESYNAAHDVSRPLEGLSKAKREAELARIAEKIERALAGS